MTTIYILFILLVAFSNYLIVYLYSILIKRKDVRKVYAIDTDEKQLEREFKNALFTTPVHALILATVYFAKLLLPVETAATIFYTFLITFFWTEVWHYFSHRAMHTKLLLFIHLEHHRSMTTGPWTAVSFSVLEKLIFSLGIALPITLLSQILPISLIGLCLYYLFYFVTNVIGHSNAEIRRRGYTNTWIGKVINTPTYHAMHHARFIKNYGLITSVLDRVFNTMWKDYEDVHESVSASRPLKNHREKYGIESKKSKTT
jgi:Delta7-sterol 5-desaturase